MKQNNFETITYKKTQIIDLIDRFQIDLKKHGVECKYKFTNITISKRKITCLVLWFESTEGIEKNNRKEYSFIFAKRNQDKITINQSIVDHVNHTLLNNLNYAKRKSATAIRKSNFFDYLKYLFCYKYFYKKEILGIDINIIRLVVVVISVVIFAVLSFQIRYSYYLEYGYYPLW